MAKKSRSKKSKQSFLSIPYKDFKFIGVLALIFVFSVSYMIFFSDNVKIKSNNYYVYIPANSNPEQLAEFLKKEEVINNAFSFQMVAQWLKLKSINKGGLFKVENGWGNLRFINELEDAELVPARILTISSTRRRNKLINTINHQLKFDKDHFSNALNDSRFLDKMDLNKESVYCIFMPGTYYIPDSLNEREFIEVMYGEFEHFFNEDRRDKMDDVDLTPTQAYILASIVYSETKNKEEMPVIAGVYLNRLKKNMKLEADPTLVYASQDFGARRVYKKKKYIYPDYNTYAHKGLPPGPIHFPPSDIVDIVLNYHDHDYIYFCAKDDGSGTHNFAETFSEHKTNAEKFREYLRKKKYFNLHFKKQKTSEVSNPRKFSN